jgi:hypothetical protein
MLKYKDLLKTDSIAARPSGQTLYNWQLTQEAEQVIFE